MSLWRLMPKPKAVTPARAVSSAMTTLNRKSSTPPPPYSSGTAMPRKPSPPAAWKTSRGTILLCSHWPYCGTTSLSRKRRKLSRNASCSSSNR